MSINNVGLNLITVKTSPEMGRGIYANDKILAGSVVMICELLVLSELDTVKVNQTELQYYTFKYNETQDCLVLGLGEIFNHADQPNVTYELVFLEDRFMMIFKAKNEINSNDQLFIDYNADAQVNVSNYIKNSSLVG